MAGVRGTAGEAGWRVSLLGDGRVLAAGGGAMLAAAALAAALEAAEAAAACAVDCSSASSCLSLQHTQAAQANRNAS